MGPGQQPSGETWVIAFGTTARVGGCLDARAAAGAEGADAGVQLVVPARRESWWLEERSLHRLCAPTRGLAPTTCLVVDLWIRWHSRLARRRRFSFATTDTSSRSTPVTRSRRRAATNIAALPRLAKGFMVDFAWVQSLFHLLKPHPEARSPACTLQVRPMLTLLGALEQLFPQPVAHDSAAAAATTAQSQHPQYTQRHHERTLDSAAVGVSLRAPSFEMSASLGATAAPAPFVSPLSSLACSRPPLGSLQRTLQAHKPMRCAPTHVVTAPPPSAYILCAHMCPLTAANLLACLGRRLVECRTAEWRPTERRSTERRSTERR